MDYLDHVLCNGERLLSPLCIAAVQNIPPPKRKKEMMSFLGMVGYCRHWIHDFAEMDAVSRASTLQDSPTQVEWSDEMTAAFGSLKQSLMSASARGLPGYDLLLHLHVTESDGFVKTVFIEPRGPHFHPVAYYSRLLKVHIIKLSFRLHQI